MLETPTVVETPSQSLAIIRLTIPRDQIRQVMGPGIHELMTTIGSQGIAPVGAWFCHHLRMDPEVFDFEIGVPVGGPVAASGRVAPSTRPALRVVRAVYQGPYEGLGAAWGELDAWVAGQGTLATTGECWETYMAGPESSPDPSAWRTLLERPLVVA